jgi:hypothetical protein
VVKGLLDGGQTNKAFLFNARRVVTPGMLHHKTLSMSSVGNG